jgi:3-dehydroquinate dehydratase II
VSYLVYVLNGPNLNLLGEREPAIYGTTTLAEVEARCHAAAKPLGLACRFLQSNYEGQLVEWIHEARAKASGIVINPAGYSFTSVAIMDALKASELPVVEVHISNIHRREKEYHHSLVSLAATGVICGLGPLGYALGLQALAERPLKPARTAEQS